MWVPAHVGTTGHEMVDRLAKRVLTKENVEVRVNRGGARGGLRGLKPRMFSVKPLMFLLPCLVSTITEFSCAIKYLFQPQICSLHI